MKLFLPVAGIIGAIGACCCGDMDELTQKLQEIEATEAPVEAESEKPADGAPSAAPAVAGPALEGACGRFKDWGLPGPSGFKMLYCADADGTGSVTMQGSGSPAEACAPLKDWAAGIGAKLTLEATMMGVTA
ncbi:MAG: hypothetical protein EXR69_15915, partial [Myxococcales bacterium]|nr:hypothetical protein [Myxococcales bacterium]